MKEDAVDKVMVIHGPNLNLLGQRETHVYGEVTLADINAQLSGLARAHQLELDILQSNHEGDIVDAIGKSKAAGVKAILINPAAYTHTSVAIRDAVLAADIPVVEVHLSNIYAREEFRHKSLIAPVSHGQISGFGAHSYILGLEAIIRLLSA
jgi:3-dehydroquinate dehydratase-2